MEPPVSSAPHKHMWVLPYRTHPDGERLANEALPRATYLTNAIRSEGANAVAAVTDGLTRDELIALTVVLAALAPPHVPTQRPGLLNWITLPAKATA